MIKLSELLSTVQNVALNSQSEEGHPFSSYASFYYDGEVVYVFIPAIALHVENFATKPKVLVFFVEDASSNKRVHERSKVTLECDVSEINSDDIRFNEIMPKFETGALGILIGTQELRLYALTPTSGEVIFGLGETYSIDTKQMEINK
jgi:putative heme iron utilization protein